MEAKLVKLEGIEAPCLLLLGSHGGQLPDEIEVDLGPAARRLDIERRGPVTWRLQPSSADDEEPIYVEVFDE